MIHRFIEDHNSSNLQQSSKCSSENNTGSLPLSESFKRLKLPRVEIQPFHRQLNLWKEILIILNVLLTKMLSWLTYRE